MILIDPKLLEQLEVSTCFGIAHSTQAKECKQCDVQMECQAKTQGNRAFEPMKELKPETKKAMEEAQAPKKETEEKKAESKKDKKEKSTPEGMPDTKGMEIDELWALLKERGGTCKDYDNPQIQKMRLIMAIKQTYK